MTTVLRCVDVSQRADIVLAMVVRHEETDILLPCACAAEAATKPTQPHEGL